MWYSIKTILQPKTLTEAYRLSQKTGTAILGGGTYLNSERNPHLDTLIDVSHMIEHNVSGGYEGVFIDGCATLQTFIDNVTTVNSECRLLQAIRCAAPSKNIRNQRTFGGELGQNRTNSDILVFFHAVNAELTVFNENERKVSIRDWDGDGIVQKIAYYPINIQSIEFTRSAPIPSAASIISGACVRTKDDVSFTIGGNCKTIQTISVQGDNISKESILNLSDQFVSLFSDDQFGSIDYKKILIETTLKRIGGLL